jgi:hypothetical protein
MKLEYALAGILFLVGAVSAGRSLASPITDEHGRPRFLIAVHEAAKALFWFSFGGFFLAYGLSNGAPEVRWLALVPISMGAIRMVAASVLSRA